MSEEGLVIEPWPLGSLVGERDPHLRFFREDGGGITILVDPLAPIRQFVNSLRTEESQEPPLTRP